MAQCSKQQIPRVQNVRRSGCLNKWADESLKEIKLSYDIHIHKISIMFIIRWQGKWFHLTNSNRKLNLLLRLLFLNQTVQGRHGCTLWSRSMSGKLTDWISPFYRHFREFRNNIQRGPRIFKEFYSLIKIKNCQENAKLILFHGYIHKVLFHTLSAVRNGHAVSRGEHPVEITILRMCEPA
jgi:hypothetical protein